MAAESDEASSPPVAASKPPAIAGGSLDVASYELSRRGSFASSSSAVAVVGGGLALSWDAEGVTLAPRTDEVEIKTLPGMADAVVSVRWQHVTAVWVFLQKSSRSGFQLEVVFETSHAGVDLDFLTVVASMNGPAGDFIGYLQTAHAGRVKDGRAPRFATSRWAAGLYSMGVSLRSLRLWLGRVSMFSEVLFSMCFFMQLQSLLTSREARLFRALSELSSEVYELHSEFTRQFLVEVSAFDALSLAWRLTAHLPQMAFATMWRVAAHTSNWIVLALLVQHLFMVIFALDSMWRTVNGVLKSCMTFHKAAHKVGKAVKKARASPEREE